MKTYLSGPITDTLDYKERFAEAADKLRAEGHTVVNPAELPQGLKYEDYIRICLPMIDCVDKLYLLPGWGRSRGAILERMYADATGKPIMCYNPKGGVQ